MNFIESMEFLPSKTDLNKNFSYFKGALLRKHFWIINYPPSAINLSYQCAFCTLLVG